MTSPSDRLRSAYLKVRNWVDDLIGPISVVSPKVALVPAMIPFLGIPIIGPWWATPAAAWAVLWLGFVGWRAFRLMKATRIKRDRAYDAKGKFRLGREYWETE